jgi:4-hydroxybenzoate polyprenyltransferase
VNETTPETVEAVEDVASESSSAASLLSVIRLLRPQHWIKNLLLLAPLLLAHELSDTSRLGPTLLAILSFSLIASLVYVINDLLDVEADRLHPTKRHRPLAAGDLSIATGCVAIALLAAGGITAALFVSTSLLALIAVYLAATTVYSCWLKQVVIADVLMLAGFYTLRLIAGGVAADVEVSEWLLAFSMFLFTSLAFSKRHAELSRLANESSSGDETVAARRGYRVSDIGSVEVMGPVAGYMSVLVFALYINRDGREEFYTYTWPLWIIALLLLYWISRLWLLARRGKLPEDPVIFAVTDPVSLLVALLVGAMAVVAAAPWAAG